MCNFWHPTGKVLSYVSRGLQESSFLCHYFKGINTVIESRLLGLASVLGKTSKLPTKSSISQGKTSELLIKSSLCSRMLSAIPVVTVLWKTAHQIHLVSFFKLFHRCFNEIRLVDKGFNTDKIYLDFCRAFNTIIVIFSLVQTTKMQL